MPPQENQNPNQPIQPQQPGQYPPLQPQQASAYVQQQYGTAQPQPVQPLQPQQSQAPQARPQISPQEYDFIVNPKQQTGKKPGGVGSFKLGKLLVVVALLVVLVIAGAVVKQLLGRKGAAETQSIVSIAQQQVEIVRVAQLILTQDGISQTTSNIAMTTNLSVATDQSNTVAYITKHGVKLNEKQLALGKDPSTDKTITAAAAAGNLDDAYMTTLKNELDKYSNTLANAYKDTSGTNLKKLLSDNYDNAQVLKKQLPTN